MPWVPILSERGVRISISLWPNPALPQLYSIDVKLPEFFRNLALHLCARCSNLASTATSATHWRMGAWVPGTPLISHRPGCAWARPDGCWAAVRASAAAAKTRVERRSIWTEFSTAEFTAVNGELPRGELK